MILLSGLLFSGFLVAAADPVTQPDVTVNIGTLLLSAGGGAIIAALVNFIGNRRKLNADAASVLSKAATELILPLQQRIQELNEDLSRLRTKIHRLEGDLDICREANVRKDAQIAALKSTHRRSNV